MLHTSDGVPFPQDTSRRVLNYDFQGSLTLSFKDSLWFVITRLPLPRGSHYP
ncbi:rCG34985 [Rattus norvegicus]|uniref:RCG34985 n=1 Tax=Rattus norvegicus TaxID=10116 RepID=A6HDP4_RAT|nr:rCG34985 [Rattus norvegicus]